MTTLQWTNELARRGLHPDGARAFHADLEALRWELSRVAMQLNDAGFRVTTHVQDAHRTLSWSAVTSGQFGFALTMRHVITNDKRETFGKTVPLSSLPDAELANVAALLPDLLAALADSVLATQKAVALLRDRQPIETSGPAAEGLAAVMGE